MSELNENIDVCVAEVLKQLTALGEKSETAAKLSQSRGALDLANQLAARMDLTPSVGSFVLKLLELANKHKALFVRSDQRYFANTVEFVMLRCKQSQAQAAVCTSMSSSVLMTASAANEFTTALKALL
jgi:predicted neuraminidase